MINIEELCLAEKYATSNNLILFPLLDIHKKQNFYVFKTQSHKPFIANGSFIGGTTRKLAWENLYNFIKNNEITSLDN